MTYTKTTWVEGGPPGISADRLNNMENGIANAVDLTSTQTIGGVKTFAGLLSGAAGVFAGNVTGRQIFAAWVDISQNQSGFSLYGNNAYTDGPNNYRYSNTHNNLGARGILMKNTSDPNTSLSYFDTGSVSTTAGTSFTPTLYNIWHTGMLRTTNGYVEWNNGGVWKPVAGYGSSKPKASGTTWGSTDATLLSVSGMGRLNYLFVNSSQAGLTPTITVIADGVTLFTYSLTDMNGYLAADGRYSSSTSGYIAANISFESSLVIKLHNDSVTSSATSTASWQYELM